MSRPEKGEQTSLVDEPRKRPYVWPTWLTKLLAGENKCWWAAWYKAHHWYLKKKDDADRADFFAEYNEKHDAMVKRRVQAFREDGWTVKVEKEGAFKIHGQAGDLAGEPDIVAMKGETAVVVDAKSGKPRASDHWQVLIYIVFLPLSWLKGFQVIKGEVEYRDGTVDVRPIEALERRQIQDALRLVTGDKAPEPRPSRNECRYCDIARCPHREEQPEGDAGGMF